MMVGSANSETAERAPKPIVNSKLEAEAEIVAFGKSVNATAERSRVLWLGHAVLITYLIVTVGAVSHRDLFLESAVRLPVLNVDLPLKGFFVVAPVFLIVNHFYLLLNLLGLSRRIQEFNKALIRCSLGKLDEHRERRSLDSFVVVQLFGGTENERQGPTRWFLSTVAWITIVIAPLSVLLLIQVQFLAYHSEWITWWHRAALLIDAFLIWVFWHAICNGGDWPNYSSFSKAPIFASFLSIAALTSVLYLNYPGETLDWRDSLNKHDEIELHAKTPLVRFFILLDKTLVRRTLDVSREVLIDRDLLNKIAIRKPRGEATWDGERTLIVSNNERQRDLVGADFSYADLRGVEMRNANLRNASFVKAQLQFASLENTDWRGANLERARFRGASLQGGKFSGASLKNARLNSSNLMNVNLQGVNLENARLRNALLSCLEGDKQCAQLQGANLRNSRMQGASLEGAKLQGAVLDDARMQGASLEAANLQGANLKRANLQGAILDRADLQIADLTQARLQFSSMRMTKLSGALLKDTNMVGASLVSVMHWRAYGSAIFEKTYVSNNPRHQRQPHTELPNASILQFVTEDRKEVVGKRLSRLEAMEEDSNLVVLSLPSTNSLSRSEYAVLLAEELKFLACSTLQNPPIVTGLTKRFTSTEWQDSVPAPILALAELLVSSSRTRNEQCLGASGLGFAAIERLEEFIHNCKCERAKRSEGSNLFNAPANLEN